MKISKKIGDYIMYIFFIVFITTMIIGVYQFRHHYAFTTGTVINITPPGYRGPGDYSIIFRYSVNGKMYNGSNDRSFCNDQNRETLKALLLGKRFPVVYGTKNPFVGHLIITQEYADKFKYTTPDSVKHYDSILNCK